MKKFVLVTIISIFWGCTQKQKKLPYLGKPTINGNDIIYPKINDFSFINQDSSIITNKTFENKIYIADFIFLSCPTICPTMNIELNKVYKIYHNNPKVNYLSHTIDPERDDVKKLKEYKALLELNENWHFVTGNRDSIYNIATKSYFAIAYKDSKEPGGYVHSGGFLLIDKNKHIRGVYNGTNPEETRRLIKDIRLLLQE